MTRVLLTGASGFVGRHALAALAASGHEVHALARRRGEDLDGAVWHECDLLAGAEVVGDVEPEVLVHLAWYAEHGKFWSSSENLRWVEGSLVLLRAFADSGGRRAVIAGSCAEYEWPLDVYADDAPFAEDALLAEDAPLRPATLYGAAKHGLHVIAERYGEQAGFELAWARLFHLYGPHEAPGRFVPSIVLPLLREEPAEMTEGRQRRDFLHAADAGSALAALADSPVAGAVNVASGEGVALRDLAARIARSIGREELLRPGARAMAPGEPPSLLGDVRRLREEVGWHPRVGLDDGLQQTIEWWRERLAGDDR